MAENEEKTRSRRRSPSTELGVTGAGPWGLSVLYSETDPELSGLLGLRKYREIMRTDPTGAAMYLLLSLFVLQATWAFVPGGEKGDEDKNAAGFAWEAFNDMDLSLLDLLSDVCSMFWAGWSWHEMVMKRRAGSPGSKYDDGRVGFRTIALRPQDTLAEWSYDDAGVVDGMWQQSFTKTKSGRVFIPLRRSCHFVTSREGSNPEGVSIYRAAVRPYSYKRRLEKIEGIGLYRRWAGFPKVTMPPDATKREEVQEGEISDEEKAENTVVAIYDDTLMGFYAPDGWKLDMGGPEGNIDDTMGQTIIRKDSEMARAILAQFFMQGMRNVGTQSLTETLLDAFMLSADAYLDIIADVFNLQAVPYLFKFNLWPGLTGLPTLTHSPVQKVDLTKVARYLKVLIDAGLVEPDPALGAFLRSLIPGAPAAVGGGAASEDTGGDDDSDIDETETASTVRGGERLSRGAAVGRFAYGVKPAPADRLAAYTALADDNARAQRANIEDWTQETAAAIADLPPDTTETDLARKLDDYVLAALLLMRERSLLDIAAAFWLGFGAPSGDGAQLGALDSEIRLSDAWMGYAGGGLSRVNPNGKPTLFGDIAGTLEGRMAALLLLLKQGKRDEVFLEVTNAVRAATRGFYRVEQYAGHVWHAAWAGSIERHEQLGGGAVRWILDPLALHCAQCPIYGADPPGRFYSSVQALLDYTGGVLPGFGTDCDGSCRCTLQRKEGGVWVPM